MCWKKGVRFFISVSILLLFVGLLGAAVATSVGVIDLSSGPEIDAEQNTTGVPAVDSTEHQTIDGKALEMEIFDALNERRIKSGVNPLIHSERIRLIARVHSADMAEREFFNHTNPDGIAPPGRHERYDGCERPNENIAVLRRPDANATEKIAEQILSMWNNSEGHNTTQMSEYYHVSGVGVYVTDQKELYVTQNFCREHPNA